MQIPLSLRGACGALNSKTTGFFRRRVVNPVLQLLRIGATPHQLAWSIAVGAMIGINPLLGSTTLLALLVATVFRLNLVGSQLGNHLMYPFELLLMPVFLKLGTTLFHTSPMPLSVKTALQVVRLHPLDTTRLLWTWEWHALVVWAAFAAIVTPALQWGLRVALERMLERLHNEPVIEK